MKKSLASLIGKKERRYAEPLSIEWLLPRQLMGIEVEADRDEVTTTYMPQTHAGWTGKRDGSLRNGMEYVLTKPLAGKELTEAISALFAEAQFNRICTGSTHIHLDMLEEETPASAVQSIFLMAYLFEDVIFQMADPGREWCGYTNKLNTAPRQILEYFLQDNIEDDDSCTPAYALERNNTGRYYGLNLHALSKFGSLEFRYWPTAMSATELADWVQLVQAFKVAALEYPTLGQLLEVFADEGTYNSFIASHFTTWQDWFYKTASFDKVKRELNIALAYANISKAQNVDKDYRTVIKSAKFSKLIKRKKSPQEIPAPYVEQRSEDGFLLNPRTAQERNDEVRRLERLYAESGNTAYRSRLATVYSTLQAMKFKAVMEQFTIPEVGEDGSIGDNFAGDTI